MEVADKQAGVTQGNGGVQQDQEEANDQLNVDTEEEMKKMGVKVFLLTIRLNTVIISEEGKDYIRPQTLGLSFPRMSSLMLPAMFHIDKRCEQNCRNVEKCLDVAKGCGIGNCNKATCCHFNCMLNKEFSNCFVWARCSPLTVKLYW